MNKDKKVANEDKFTWKEGDVKFLSPEEVKKERELFVERMRKMG